MNGLVIKSTGNAYLVRMDDGKDLECHIKGNFRIRGIRSTAPVAVGDIVEVEMLPDGTNWIREVCTRRNYIIRRSTNLSHESHILAANLDQVLLLVTLKHPATSTTFIDRFLATAEAYRVPVVLVFNKIDMLSPDEMQELNELSALYKSIGYSTMAISASMLADQPDKMAELSGLLAGKVTLLSGNSGVGKSTLLNALFGSSVTRTGRISDAHDKGMHTTTFSAMYSLDPIVGADSSWLIDTPGIKGFGGVDMSKREVSHYFREIFRIGRECRYDDCLHSNSGCGCAVYDAVVRGEIALSRYESYLSLLGDAEEQKYR
ncbi:MAG: ribosome small subunit-dependent GTPase A [Paludibacteraceae bacterium]|nr:ribosome small subunit-dependent GTPase A [Paludibacteraceae bacterium]